MAKTLYWIEDENHLFMYFHAVLSSVFGCVNVWGDAAKVLHGLDSVRENPGPILLDLTIPLGSPGPETVLSQVAGEIEGPWFGLTILEKIQECLGVEHPVVILSGNVTYVIKKKLREDYGIPDSRIFVKPLNSQLEKLIETVRDL